MLQVRGTLLLLVLAQIHCSRHLVGSPSIWVPSAIFFGLPSHIFIAWNYLVLLTYFHYIAFNLVNFSVNISNNHNAKHLCMQMLHHRSWQDLVSMQANLGIISQLQGVPTKSDSGVHLSLLMCTKIKMFRSGLCTQSLHLLLRFPHSGWGCSICDLKLYCIIMHFCCYGK